jgi:hypothetical protein
MQWATLFFILLPVLGGCTHVTLQKDTVRTTNTLTDLEFQQVLDNLARFHDSPDTMPSFAVATAGTVSVLDTTGAGVSPTYSPTLPFSLQGGGALPVLSLLFPFSAQRAITENWSLTPVTDADNIRRLRCAFRLVVMGEATPNYEFCRKEMKDFFAGESAATVDYYPPRNWYGIGTKKVVPKEACYVGHHGCTYVWVTPDGMNGLTLFTMGALDLATGKTRTPQRTVVRKYKGDLKPENLVETQVTTTEDDENALEVIRKGRTPLQDRPRLTNPYQFNPGLLFVPR